VRFSTKEVATLQEQLSLGSPLDEQLQEQAIFSSQKGRAAPTPPSSIPVSPAVEVRNAANQQRTPSRVISKDEQGYALGKVRTMLLLLLLASWCCFCWLNLLLLLLPLLVLTGWLRARQVRADSEPREA